MNYTILDFATDATCAQTPSMIGTSSEVEVPAYVRLHRSRSRLQTAAPQQFFFASRLSLLKKSEDGKNRRGHGGEWS